MPMFRGSKITYMFARLEMLHRWCEINANNSNDASRARDCTSQWHKTRQRDRWSPTVASANDEQLTLTRHRSRAETRDIQD